MVQQQLNNVNDFSKKVTVICVTWNNYEYFKLMYESLVNLSYDSNIKLICHINEDVDEKTRKFCDINNITYTYSENNLGIFLPLNNLVNLVETDYILFWADDITFLENWDYYLLPLLKYLEVYNQEDSCWISPRLIERENCFAPQEHPYCTIENLANTIDEFNDNYRQIEEKVKQLRINKINKLPNGNMILKKTSFQELNGYDLEYKAGNDSDLTWRFVKKFGTDGIKQSNMSLCYHWGSVVTGRDKNKRHELEKQGADLFYKKHGFFIGDITKRILENNI